MSKAPFHISLQGGYCLNKKNITENTETEMSKAHFPYRDRSLISHESTEWRLKLQFEDRIKAEPLHVTLDCIY